MDVKTVRKNDFSHPAMDFFGLRNSAIEYLQQLSGEEWTDFNEHDPGVTILDQLCYAITDLSYRTNYDIADLLAGKPEYYGKVTDPQNPLRPVYRDTFYTLDEVMPCHPLTITDWRKLIIDRVENVRNAWIEPLKHDHLHPIGIYRILIEAVKEEDGEKSMEKLRKTPGENHQKIVEAYHEQIRQEVSKVFHDNRNLCEDLESVQILKERDVQIKASIEIDDQAVSEKLLAEIYFTIEKYFSHPIRRYPLNQMLEKGHTIGTIFNGPRLKNGFIVDEELYPLIKHIHYAGLIRAILDIPEVKNIQDFRIKGADDDKKVFELGELEVPVFNMKSSQSDALYKIVLSKNSNLVYIDEPLVNSHYEAFKLSQPKPFIPRQHEQSLRAFDVKLGRDRKVSEYRSVQYNFPPVYGIGEFGVDADIFVSKEIPGKKRSARRVGLAAGRDVEVAHELRARHAVLRHQAARQLERGVVLGRRVGVGAGVEVLKLDAERHGVAAAQALPVHRPAARARVPGYVLVGHQLRDAAGLVDVVVNRDGALLAAAAPQPAQVAGATPPRGVQHHHAYAPHAALLEVVARHAKP